MSQFQTYACFLSHPALQPEVLQQAKGARIVNRQLQWGSMRVDGEKVSWVTQSKEITLDDVTLQQFFDLEGGLFRPNYVT